MPRLTKTPEERFWKFVNKRGEDDCWLWIGSATKKGYGQLSINNRPVRAHRFAWVLANKREIPQGLDVLHSCDIPSCVNAKHLSIGTDRENRDDAVKKHRMGSPGKPKLEASQVNTIRDLFLNKGFSAISISKMFNINRQTVYNIISGKTWNPYSRKSRNEVKIV